MAVVVKLIGLQHPQNVINNLLVTLFNIAHKTSETRN